MRYNDTLIGSSHDLIKLFKLMLETSDIKTKKEMLILLQEQIDANRKN